MPNGDPRDGFFYPTLTLMIDSYMLTVDYIEAHWYMQISGHHYYSVS